MSTTFAVKIEHTGMEAEVAKRSSGEIWFTHGLAELLSDETPVIPIDNTAQGIYTIGDIRNEINRKARIEDMNRLIDTINAPAQEESSWIKDPSKIEFRQRKSAFVPIQDAWHEEHDFIEVTEWTNGEGWDIVISDDKYISLHFTEFAILKELIERMENQ
jgi:hypothetical protein